MAQRVTLAMKGLLLGIETAALETAERVRRAWRSLDAQQKAEAMEARQKARLLERVVRTAEVEAAVAADEAELTALLDLHEKLKEKVRPRGSSLPKPPSPLKQKVRASNWGKLSV